MRFDKLTSITWEELENLGNKDTGYFSICLAAEDDQLSDLHIFCDEFGYYHFAIKAYGKESHSIQNPSVNGLDITLKQYKLDKNDVTQFIDISCNNSGYLREFTEVVKEITYEIIASNIGTADAINHVIRKWKSFWTNQHITILSEEAQIGLVCELLVLEKLLTINTNYALNSWEGPLGQIHDFSFSDWNLEIKGTRRKGHIHTINGIEQLKAINNKKLAFISFQVSVTNHEQSICLQGLIEDISGMIFQRRPDLINKFYELLSEAGYSPVFLEEYKKLKLEVNDAFLYIVDNSFPALTIDKIIEPLSPRITAIKYNISLDGMFGLPIQDVNWGEYFY